MGHERQLCPLCSHDLYQKVSGALRTITKTTASITEDAHLTNEIGLDSLDLTEFLLKVEDELHIEIDFDSLNPNDLLSLRAFTTFLANNWRART
jgi:acyl carrier protein